MKKVKVLVKDLLIILKENREKHKNAMDEVMALYRKKVIEELDKALQAAKEGRDIITNLNLVRPINMTQHYDRAIGMLSMSVDAEVEITQEEYANYVLDKWHWSDTICTNAMSYVSSSSSSSEPSSSAASLSVSAPTLKYLQNLRRDEDDDD